MRYDLKKLLADTKALESGQALTYEWARWKPNSWLLTALYSARAHARGRLHMTALREDTWYVYVRSAPVDEPLRMHGGSKVYAWTLEDQEKLIEKLLPTYLKAEEPGLEAAVGE
jgi:hypothetical protein